MMIRKKAQLYPGQCDQLTDIYLFELLNLEVYVDTHERGVSFAHIQLQLSSAVPQGLHHCVNYSIHVEVLEPVGALNRNI